MVLHKPVQKNVFNVRASYQREAEKAVTHLHTLGVQRIAVVHADRLLRPRRPRRRDEGLRQGRRRPQ
jgi:DNA-binding LacI/PurR family transcriptional regulator